MQRDFRRSVSLLATLFLGACGTPLGSDGPFDLTFQGDATFQEAHGGQTVSVAVRGGTVLATKSGTVSSTEDPSFSFTFRDLLIDGASYRVHYWIDSNFGGGQPGVCDPPEIDHQWRVDLGVIESDVTHVESHDPGAVTSVCSSFPP